MLYLHMASRLRCALCHKPVAKKDRHVDHIFPLGSKNPVHSAYTLQVTHSWCNESKGTKLPEELTGQMELRLYG